MTQLRVELFRSLSGHTKSQRQTARGLGLTRRHQTVIVDDTPEFRGMINKIAHLLRVEEVQE